MLAALMSIAFVYLLMGFLFESFLLPLAILITIPLASMGVTWIHLLAGRDLDFLGLVGLIILIGVVVNNGIVLLDSVNRLRAGGMERGKAPARSGQPALPADHDDRADHDRRHGASAVRTTDPDGPELQELRVDPDRGHGRGDPADATRGAGVLHLIEDGRAALSRTLAGALAPRRRAPVGSAGA